MEKKSVWKELSLEWNEFGKDDVIQKRIGFLKN